MEKFIKNWLQTGSKEPDESVKRKREEQAAAEKRKVNARRKLVALLGLEGHKGAGRPSFHRKDQEAKLQPLLDCFLKSPEADFDKWWSEQAKLLYEKKGWTLHKDMLPIGGGEGMLDEEEGDSSEEEGEEDGKGGSGKASEATKAIRRSYAHKWDKKGQHAGFYTAKELRQRLKEDLGHTIGKMTAYRYLNKEKEWFEKKDERAATKKGDITQIIDLTRSVDKDREQLMIKQEPSDRPPVFPPEWYPQLKKRCEAVR